MTFKSSKAMYVEPPISVSNNPNGKSKMPIPIICHTNSILSVI